MFLDDGVNQVTFKDAYQYVTRLGYVLAKYDPKRVGLYIDNTIKSALLINACWAAGIEVALLNTRLTQQEMMAQMSSINVKYIIATHELSLLDFKIIQLAELESNMSDQQIVPHFSLESIASIMFTSGTTGPQKQYHKHLPIILRVHLVARKVWGLTNKRNGCLCYQSIIYQG